LQKPKRQPTILSNPNIITVGHCKRSEHTI
jgi:hypothetical protein